MFEPLLLRVEVVPALGRCDRQVEVERVLAGETALKASLVARVRRHDLRRRR
jgi:hypothetical protein